MGTLTASSTAVDRPEGRVRCVAWARPVDVEGWIYTWDPDHPAGGLDAQGPEPLASAWRAILPDVFYVRGWWYPGPEPGLALLAERAPGIHAAFAAALAPNAGRAELEALVHGCLHPPT